MMMMMIMVKLRHSMDTEINNILVPEQFGSRHGISIKDTVFTLTDTTLNVSNNAVHTGGIFRCVAEVFNCVNHETVIVQLCFVVFKEQFLTTSESMLHIENKS